MLHVNGLEKDARRLETFFQRMRIGSKHVKAGSVDVRKYSYLIINNIRVVDGPPIREWEDFYVFCSVLGNRDRVKVRWFKDGVLINPNATR